MTERSGFGGLRRLDPWRTEDFFYFALLIWVIEKLFYCEIYISWCFGYSRAVHAFWRIENSFWVYLSFDFALHINLLCQKRFFRGQAVSNLWLYLEVLLFVRLWGLLWLFKDIPDDIFHIDLFVWDSVLFGSWEMPELVSFQGLIEIFDCDQRTFNGKVLVSLFFPFLKHFSPPFLDSNGLTYDKSGFINVFSRYETSENLLDFDCCLFLSQGTSLVNLVNIEAKLASLCLYF